MSSLRVFVSLVYLLSLMYFFLVMTAHTFFFVLTPREALCIYLADTSGLHGLLLSSCLLNLVLRSELVMLTSLSFVVLFDSYVLLLFVARSECVLLSLVTSNRLVLYFYPYLRAVHALPPECSLDLPGMKPSGFPPLCNLPSSCLP